MVALKGGGSWVRCWDGHCWGGGPIGITAALVLCASGEGSGIYHLS